MDKINNYGKKFNKYFNSYAFRTGAKYYYELVQYCVSETRSLVTVDLLSSLSSVISVNIVGIDFVFL